MKKLAAIAALALVASVSAYAQEAETDMDRLGAGLYGELHPGEVIEEKISLSERFGLWLSFYSFSQDQYLQIAQHWLAHFGASPTEIEAARGDALLWALERGARSGRVARQFAQGWSAKEQSALS